MSSRIDAGHIIPIRFCRVRALVGARLSLYYGFCLDPIRSSSARQRQPYRDRRLTGWKFVRGLLSFALICSFGAVANVGIATLLFTERHAFWWVAGIAGAAMSAVWNYAMTSVLTWHSR